MLINPMLPMLSMLCGSCSPRGKLFWHAYGTPWAILMEECWAPEASARPTMAAVKERITRIRSKAQPEQQQQPRTAPAAMQHNQQGGQQHGLLESDGSTVAALIPQSSPTGSVTDGSMAEESACDASLHEELRQLREACARNATAEEEVQRLRVCLAESHKQNLELRHKAVFPNEAPARVNAQNNYVGKLPPIPTAHPPAVIEQGTPETTGRTTKLLLDKAESQKRISERRADAAAMQLENSCSVDEFQKLRASKKFNFRNCSVS